MRSTKARLRNASFSNEERSKDEKASWTMRVDSHSLVYRGRRRKPGRKTFQSSVGRVDAWCRLSASLPTFGLKVHLRRQRLSSRPFHSVEAKMETAPRCPETDRGVKRPCTHRLRSPTTAEQLVDLRPSIGDASGHR